MSQMDIGPAATIAGELPGITDLQVIGRGGFATVYKGWQRAFRRPVAVKVFDERPGTPTLVHFRKEAEAMGSLSSHPHVVGLYDAGIVGGRPYLVMPYLSGGSLQDRLQRGPLPAAEVARVGMAIAGALSAAHSMGLLHRDVKPANILFTAYGEPQLGDFGIARFADSTLTNGEVAATVAYAAPEVLRGERATPRSDVYALGATLYAALSGAPPFEATPGESLVSFAMRTIREQPRDLRGRGVPAPLARVIGRSIAKQPGQRQASAEELLSDMRAVAGALSMRAAPAVAPTRPAARRVPKADVGAPEVRGASPNRKTRDNKHRRTLLGGAGGVLVLAAIAAVVALAATPARRLPAPVASPDRPVTTVATLGRSSASTQRVATSTTRHATTATTARTAPSSSRPPASSIGSAPRTSRPSTPSTLAPGPGTTAHVATTGVARSTRPPATKPTAGSPTTASSPRTTVTRPPSPTSTPAQLPPAQLAQTTTAPPSVSAADVASYVGNYYSIVNSGRLGTSWQWLSPAFQARLGWPYYQSFWHSITNVGVEAVSWTGNGADMTLRYQEASGAVSVEHVAITFMQSGGHVLIDSYRVL